MENLYEKLPVLNKYKLANEQMALENNISVNGEDNAVKVLSSSAYVDITSPVECLKGECNVSGVVVTNVVYMCENGELNNQTSKSPFTFKYTDENIDTSSRVNVSAEVIATQIDKVQGNQIKLLTTLSFNGVVLKNAEIEYLKEAGDNTYVKQQEQTLVAFDRQNCEKFEENLQASVKDGVKKVLMTNVDFVLNEWSAGTNFICVQGQLYAKILYANNQEVSELQTITISKDFKQELEADGLNKDLDADLFAHIIHENIQVELEEKENGETSIDVNVPLLVCYNVYTCNNILSVQDIYSVADVLAVTQGDCTTFKSLKPEILEGKIEGNVVLTDNDARVDKYLATTNVCSTISNSYIQDDTLFIEGVVSANVVYLNDELGTIQSVEIEIPYVLDKKVDIVGDVILEPTITLFDVDVMVKRGREIFFDAKAKAFVNVTLKTNACMVTKVESISKLPPRDSAIEIYFALAGQSFWDIAKGLKIPMETIINQNPNLTDPLEKDENIAIYYQKERKTEN